MTGETLVYAQLTPMSSYSRLHRAMLDVAREERLTPADVRLLVAIYERGCIARTDELEADMCCEGTMIRRSIAFLRDRYVTATASDGGETRQGMRSVLELLERGHDVARRVLEAVST